MTATVTLTEKQAEKLAELKKKANQTHTSVSGVSGKGPELKHNISHGLLYAYAAELGIVTKRKPDGSYFWKGTY